MVKIIAEVANAHEGELKRAIKIAKDAAYSGADAVKFQIYFGPDLLTKNHPRYTHFCNQAFKKDEWKFIISETRKHNKKIIADIFGFEALEVAISNKVDAIKIHSSDLSNIQLIQESAKIDVPIFLATGGSTLIEIKNSVDAIRSVNVKKEIVLMHGYQAYPTKIENNDLLRILELKDFFGDSITYGFMDHADASKSNSMYLPALSIALGCSFIEKHITDDRSKKGIDYYSSLEKDEFKKFVNFCKDTELYLGKKSLNRSEDEEIYRSSVKKVFTAAKKISKDTKISIEHVEMLRSPNNGISDIKILEGKRSIQSIKRGDLLGSTNIDRKVLAIVVARSKSSRLKGKATLKVGNVTAIEHLFKRLELAKNSNFIDEFVFCTTENESDDDLANFVDSLGIKVFRGAEENVLKRMMSAISEYPDFTSIIRVTGDDIFIEPDYLKKTLDHHFEMSADYTDAKNLPSGTEVEVFESSVLKFLIRYSKDSSGTEYLTNYITDNSHLFDCTSLPVSENETIHARLTLDTEKDYELISGMIDHFVKIDKEYSYKLSDILAYFKEYPDKINLNKNIIQRKIPKNFSTEIDYLKMCSKPLVTVYITNFNYDKYLKESIESVLNQNFSRIEIIIIDDGSSDSSNEILNYYEDVYGIKVIRNKNKGLTASNNDALNLANGKYIMRLDADDYLHKNAVDLLVLEIEKNDDIVAVFPDYAIVSEDGNVLNFEMRHSFKDDVSLFDSPAHGACTLAKVSILRDAGGYNENYLCQDGWDAWIKIRAAGRVSNVNLPLFYYRQHGKNLTGNKARLLETRSRILKDYTDKKNKKSVDALGIIPIRDNTESPLALKQLDSGENLLSITINQLRSSRHINQVVVSTNNEYIIKYLNSSAFKDIAVHRRVNNDPHLFREIDNVVKTIIEDSIIIGRNQYKYISIVNYEYPLRKYYFIDQSIDVIETFDAESSMTISKINMNFYKNTGSGLVALDNNTNLKKERDIMYGEWGGIHTVLFDAFLKNNKIHQKRQASVELDEKSAFKIETEFDFKLCKLILENK